MTDALNRLPLALRGLGLLLAGVVAAACVVLAAAVALVVTVVFSARTVLRIPGRGRGFSSAPTQAGPGPAARVSAGTPRVHDATAVARA